jgi:hypothetical protein
MPGFLINNLLDLMLRRVQLVLYTFLASASELQSNPKQLPWCVSPENISEDN